MLNRRSTKFDFLAQCSTRPNETDTQIVLNCFKRTWYWARGESIALATLADAAAGKKSAHVQWPWSSSCSADSNPVMTSDSASHHTSTNNAEDCTHLSSSKLPQPVCEGFLKHVVVTGMDASYEHWTLLNTNVLTIWVQVVAWALATDIGILLIRNV